MGKIASRARTEGKGGRVHRQRDPGPAATILTTDALRLRHVPAADCARYDQLRST